MSGKEKTMKRSYITKPRKVAFFVFFAPRSDKTVLLNSCVSLLSPNKLQKAILINNDFITYQNVVMVTIDSYYI